MSDQTRAVLNRSQLNRIPSTTPIDFVKLRRLTEARAETFSRENISWLNYFTPLDFAKAGFYLREDIEKVQCVFCKGFLSDYEIISVSPIDIHRENFPDCRFVIDYDLTQGDENKLSVHLKDDLVLDDQDDFPLNDHHVRAIRDILDFELMTQWMDISINAPESGMLLSFTNEASTNDIGSLKKMIRQVTSAGMSNRPSSSKASDERYRFEDDRVNNDDEAKHVQKLGKKILEVWINTFGPYASFNSCVEIVRLYYEDVAREILEKRNYLKSLGNQNSTSTNPVSEPTPFSYLQVNFDFIPEKPIGQGAFGKVFHVRYKADGKYYALKYFGLLLDEVDRESAVLASLLPHRNIVRYHFCWYETEIDKYSNPYITPGPEKFRFIQMEFCDGGNLRQWLNRNIPRTHWVDEAGLIFAQVIQALVHLHENEIVHRDIKPENIFLQRNERDLVVKLGDFGLARQIDKLDMTSRRGTPFYKAPELRQRRQRMYDESVDIFSTGKVYYELYADVSLEKNEDVWIEKIEAVEQFEFIEGFENQFPEKVSLIKAMLANDAKLRPSAPEIRDFLEGAPHMFALKSQLTVNSENSSEMPKVPSVDSKCCVS